MFLRRVVEAYSKGSNARAHHAKLLESFLQEQQGRLKLVFLPPYSSELNVVEGLWKWLKSDVINNVFYHAVSEIRKNVHSFMEQIMKNPIKIIDIFVLGRNQGSD